MIKLSSLQAGDGSTGFVLKSAQPYDQSGASVSTAGDVNGDGLDDLIIGAPYGGTIGSSTGKIYVVFGSPNGFPAQFELSTLATGDASTGFVVNGVDAQHYAGYSVSSAGDVNGDGMDDLIMGVRWASPNNNPLAGESYVVFGNAAGFPPQFELSTLATGDGSNGFVMNGIDVLDLSGYWVDTAGDVNGDGLDDLIIGAPYGDPNGLESGEIYVVFGSSNGFLVQFELSTLAAGDASAGFVLNGVAPGDAAGMSVSAAGDVNSDGIDDLIVGARKADANNLQQAGESYVVFGNSAGFPSQFELSSLAGGDGSDGFVLKGFGSFDRSGRSVDSAGDVNGDGMDDLIIGAPRAGLGGESYVIFGRTTGFSSQIELSSIATGDGSGGFVVNAVEQYDYAGVSVSAAGDVNGDGVDDFILSATGASAPLTESAGETYVVFGRTTGFPAQFELSSLAEGDGSTGFVVQGIDQEDVLGVSVSTAGDVNGDGVDDVIIGARIETPYFGGESYVVYGRASDSDGDGLVDSIDNCQLIANTDQRDTNGDGYGNMCDPDINNDGVINFLDISAWLPFFDQVNNSDEDFTGDGIANFLDYTLFKQYFLQPPEPSLVGGQRQNAKRARKPLASRTNW